MESREMYNVLEAHKFGGVLTILKSVTKLDGVRACACNPSLRRTSAKCDDSHVMGGEVAGDDVQVWRRREVSGSVEDVGIIGDLPEGCEGRCC